MMDNLSLFMFPVMILVVFAGFPVVFSLMGISLYFGIVCFGPEVIPMIIRRVYGVADNYVLAAVPLFIFMGTMLERSGIAKILFETISMWTGRIKNGLAVTTILMCTIIAACTGIIGAAEVMVGVMALPPMMKRGYNHSLIAGTIIAGGALGTIIPPSVVTVVYGPAAGISVGRLLIATIFPGFLLSTVYVLYILIRSYGQKGFAPPISGRGSGYPPVTETQGHGHGNAALRRPDLHRHGHHHSRLCRAHGGRRPGRLRKRPADDRLRQLFLKVLQEATLQTLKISSMMMMILLGGFMFSGVFLGLGGSDATERLLSALNMGPWAVLAFFMFVVYLAGFLLDWASILLIFVPIFSPIIEKLGFDPIWFGALFIMMIQTSYLTPPMAPGIFYLKGIAPPELTTREIFRGIVPYMLLQLVAIAIVAFFPQIALWLPEKLIGWN